MLRWVALGLLMSCAGGAPKERPSVAKPATVTAQPIPVDAPPAARPPSVAATSSPWFVQVLDYDPNSWTAPEIFALPTGVAILESAGSTSTWIRRTTTG